MSNKNDEIDETTREFNPMDYPSSRLVDNGVNMDIELSKEMIDIDEQRSKMIDELNGNN